MRRKTMIVLLYSVLGLALLAGCAKTPEESLVKQKGAASLKNYEEAEEPETTGKDAAAEDSQTAGDGSDTAGEGDSGVSGILRQSLGAPEHYQSEVTDETGKLQILTDAQVEIPDADKVSAIAVSQHPFDQDVMDRITDTFFPEAAIYTDESYSGWTKDDYQKVIEELKGYVAEGNLDPYDWGTDENGNYYYDIYQEIETYEQGMQEAPEERKLEEVHPQYGLTGDTQGSDQFFGVACQSDGTVYNYIMKTYDSMPMEVRLAKVREASSPQNNMRWMEYSSAVTNSFEYLPDAGEMEQEIGISLEEAEKIADEKTASLQLENMEMTSWEYGICYEDAFGQAGAELKMADAGYILHYTRVLNGIPITYTPDWGGALEDMDSVMETWGYEVLDFIITKDGIDMVYFNNQYDIGEPRTENLNLMSFEKIMEIYEKMMMIQNADILNYSEYEIYHIDRIVFGYSRIYEPASDSRSGILVPVWDFFGSDDSKWGETEYTSSSGNSYLTINAIDGSIIDRGLGY